MTREQLVALMDESYRDEWAAQMNFCRKWTGEEREVNVQAMYAVLDALSEAGLAVVPKEPDDNMVEACADLLEVEDGTFVANTRDGLRDAIVSGDLLRKED